MEIEVLFEFEESIKGRLDTLKNVLHKPDAVIAFAADGQVANHGQGGLIMQRFSSKWGTFVDVKTIGGLRW